jgi:hypothetical protein
LRRGDAVVTWADDNHLAAELGKLQREWEHRTEIVVTASHSLAGPR